MKRCNNCGINKPTSEFYKKVGGKDGRAAVCVKCIKAKSIDRYKTPEYRASHRKWAQEWRRKHNGYYRKTKKEYYNKNRDKILSQNRTIYAKQKACRAILWAAYQRGRILKPKFCEQCGEITSALHAHHDDYDKPLEIIWLCIPCHGIHTRQ